MKRYLNVLVILTIALTAVCGFSVTNDLTNGGNTFGGVTYAPFVLRASVNCSATANQSGLAGTNLQVNQTYKLISIPSNTLVTSMAYGVSVAESTNSAITFCVGDNTSTNTWVNGVSTVTIAIGGTVIGGANGTAATTLTGATATFNDTNGVSRTVWTNATASTALTLAGSNKVYSAANSMTVTPVGGTLTNATINLWVCGWRAR